MTGPARDRRRITAAGADDEPRMAGLTGHAEPDAMLRRFERNQILVCLAMAAVPAAIGRFAVALGVLGGGLLMAISYRAIKGARSPETDPAQLPE